MTQEKGKDNRNTVNAGQSSKKKTDEFKIGGNHGEKGEDPSPDDRERGEASGKDRNASVDAENR